MKLGKFSGTIQTITHFAITLVGERSMLYLVLQSDWPPAARFGHHPWLRDTFELLYEVISETVVILFYLLSSLV